MHILFVHQNYPAQFGHVARHLAHSEGWRCTFVSKTPEGDDAGVRKIAYDTDGGARESTHYCSRSFENATWHAHGVFRACAAHPEVQPDLIVGHSGFGSTAFLPELYPNVPIINYFEYYYHPHNSDMDFRPEFPPQLLDFLRARARNAALLLDLETCRRGYSPTHFQRNLFPDAYRSKIEVIFDGVETDIFRRVDQPLRLVAGREIPRSTRVVTYVSRGFESMRGFDMFMKTAKRIYQQYPDVIFIAVGGDRVHYGGDERHIRHPTFREHVLAQDDYDLSKFIFTGLVPVRALVELYSLADLHLYWTVPFVLSWSLMNSLACGCTVLASDTAPVAEMIIDGQNGLLCDFNDVEGFAARAVEVLRNPILFRPIGDAAARLIEATYSMTRTLPKLVRFYKEVVAGRE
jgi:glycosyltransferase involved in cell wall biosynthesis